MYYEGMCQSCGSTDIRCNVEKASFSGVVDDMLEVMSVSKMTIESGVWECEHCGTEVKMEKVVEY